MISRKNGLVLLGALAILLAACTTGGPVGPSLPDGQFVVIVKGEPGPLKSFNEFMQRQGNRMRPDCERKVPSGGEGAARDDAPVEVLVYQCSAASRMKGGDLLEQFARAYGNSIASLLEMKITTSAACVARSCFGGPMRYWQQNPPCSILC